MNNKTRHDIYTIPYSIINCRNEIKSLLEEVKEKRKELDILLKKEKRLNKVKKS